MWLQSVQSFNHVLVLLYVEHKIREKESTPKEEGYKSTKDSKKVVDGKWLSYVEHFLVVSSDEESYIFFKLTIVIWADRLFIA